MIQQTSICQSVNLSFCQYVNLFILTPRYRPLCVQVAAYVSARAVFFSTWPGMHNETSTTMIQQTLICQSVVCHSTFMSTVYIDA
jgi:hypothetical protein